MDFVRIIAVLAPGNCAVGEINGYKKGYKLLKFASLASEFPADASFTIAARTMKGAGMKAVVQGDLLPNGESVLLASPELAELLAAAGGEVESLPTQVFDAKEKASKPYVIVRPLKTFDVIKTPQEELKFNALAAGEVQNHVSELAFDFSEVPENLGLCVATGLPAIYLARRAFAEDLAARFSGILIRELNDPIS